MIYFSSSANDEVMLQIQAVQMRLSERIGDWAMDFIPSFVSLLVIYDAMQIDHFQVSQLIQESLALTDKPQAEPPNANKIVTLPVYYSQESGPDLTSIAQHANLSVEEVIQLHSQRTYLVYSIGFAPGFAYMGEVDPLIAVPRLKTPRKRVLKGAVAIADQQTAVYPSPSPGGWNLIGLCPTPLFDLASTPVMPVKVGDRVNFQPITQQEYEQLAGLQN
jgi:KipI family sensor histidine kinase inhibitor